MFVFVFFFFLHDSYLHESGINIQLFKFSNWRTSHADIHQCPFCYQECLVSVSKIVLPTEGRGAYFAKVQEQMQDLVARNNDLQLQLQNQSLAADTLRSESSRCLMSHDQKSP